MFYNLYLNDVATQTRKPGFRLDRQGGRWYTVTTNRNGREVAFLAKGEYDFVSRNGVIMVERFDPNGSAHTALAGAGPVDYAGRVWFGHRKTSRGVMRRWDNGSGHFEPSANAAGQAGFPMNMFVALPGT